MHRAIKLTIITLIAVISQTTWANNKISTMTGLQLSNACIAGLKQRPRVASTDTLVTLAKNSATCTNYVNAANDSVQLMLGLVNSQIIDSNNKNHTNIDIIKKPYCIPDNTSDEEKINTVINFIAESSEDMTANAASAIYNAFVKYYPCK